MQLSGTLFQLPVRSFLTSWNRCAAHGGHAVAFALRHNGQHGSSRLCLGSQGHGAEPGSTAASASLPDVADRRSQAAGASVE